MPGRVLVLLALTLGADPAVQPHPVERWADPAAPEGGDGSRDRPWRSLSEALESKAERIHLAAGVYPGPFLIEGDVELRGEGAATLVATKGAVVTVRGSLVLRGVRVVGADRGLDVTGEVRLERVRLEGQAEAGLRVTGGDARLSEVELRGFGPDATGILARGDARVEVERSRFAGAYRHGVDARGGAVVKLRDCRFRGVNTAVTLIGGRGELRGISVVGGRAAALLIGSGATAELLDISVSGHPQGLLVNTDADVRASRVWMRQLDRGAVVVMRGRLQLDRAWFERPGRDFAFTSMSGVLGLSRLTIVGAGSAALFAHQGSLGLKRAWLVRTRHPDPDLGDALHLRGARAHLEQVVIDEASGACVIVAERAEATVDGLRASGCTVAGVLADLAEVWLTDSRIALRDDVPAVLALEQGKVAIESLVVVGTTTPVRAQCEAGARVELAAPLANWAQGQRCVTAPARLPPPPARPAGSLPDP